MAPERAGAVGIGAGCADRRGANVPGGDLLNPHVYLDTVVLIGALANEESDLRWFFGAGAWAASVVWFAVLGFSAGRLQPFFATPAAWRILDALVAVTMIGVAVVVLVTSPSVPTANVALII